MGDELGVESEEDVCELCVLGDKHGVGFRMSQLAIGETIHVDGKGRVDREDVVEAVADGRSG